MWIEVLADIFAFYVLHMVPTSQIWWAEKQWQKIGDVWVKIYLDEASNDSGSRHTVFHVAILRPHAAIGPHLQRWARRSHLPKLTGMVIGVHWLFGVISHLIDRCLPCWRNLLVFGKCIRKSIVRTLANNEEVSSDIVASVIGFIGCWPTCRRHIVRHRHVFTKS